MGQLHNLKAWKLELPENVVAALAERVADDRYQVVHRKWFTAGRSGAPVALVLRSAPGESEQVVLKFCDFDGRHRVLNLRTAWQESPGFRQHMAQPDDHTIHLTDDWRAVFMRVARGDILEMVPLTDLYDDERFHEYCATIVRSVLQDWNDNRVVAAEADVGVLIQVMLGRRAGKAEEWAYRAGVAVDEPLVQLENWRRPLPNPFAFVSGREGRRKVDALIVGKAHGDLSGRNVVVPAEAGVAADRYVLIDYDRYSSRAPLARDPMHLLVALVLDRFGPEKPDVPTRELAEFVVDPRRQKVRSLESFRELSETIHAESAEFGKQNGFGADFKQQSLLSLIGVGLVHLGRKLHVRDENAVKEWCFHVAALAAAKYLENALRLEPSHVTVSTASSAEHARKAAPELVDREDVLGQLRTRLMRGPGGVLVVRGQPGIGKTALVDAVLRELANGTTRVHQHTVNPLIQLDAGTLTDYIAGDSDPTTGQTGGSSLAGLEAVLQRLGDRRVVVALDSAENLIDPDTGKLDPDLDKALDLLAGHHEHRVTVVLVTNRDFESATDSPWPHAEEPVLVPRLPEKYFFQYLDSLDPAGRTASADFTEETRRELHKRLQGNPRFAELACAVVVFAETALDLPSLTELLLRQNAKDVPAYLARTLFDGLSPVQRHVLQALAIFGTPVPASAVRDMCDDDVAEKAQQALTGLAANRIVRHADGEYSVLPEDSRMILRDLHQDDAERRRLYRKAARLLIPLRPSEPRGINDLRVHFAELEALVRAGSPGETLDRLKAITKVLREWNCTDRLRKPRELIRDRLTEFDTMANENALGGIYVALGKFDLADDAYGKALTIAHRNQADEVKVKLYVNLATMYWHQNDTEQALRYYEFARDEARRLDRPMVLMTAFEGIADCHRRRGHYEQAISQAENALAVPGLVDYPDSAEAQRNAITGSVAVALKLARWFGELGRLDDAERLIDVAESTAEGKLNDWLTASCLDGRADMLYDQGHYEQAASTAHKAVNQALRLRDGVTLLQARTTLCLAYLRMDRAREAYAEIEAAQGYRRELRSLIVLALYGLAARWKGDRAEALLRFGQLKDEATVRIERDSEDFAAKDFRGLASCGLRMDVRDDDLADAISDFEEARSQTPPTPVLLDRLRFMLAQLEMSCRWPDRLRPVIDVLSDPTGRIG